MMESGLAATVKTLVVLVLVAPLIVMTDPLPPTFFPYIVGKALYIHTLIQIAAGLWLILAFWYPSHRIPRSLLLPILGVYVALALLSSLLGVSPQRSLWSTYERMQGWIDLAHWFAFTVVLVSVFRSFRDWRALLNFNLAVSLGMAALGLAQSNDIKVFGYLAPSNRLDITLGNATFVGAYMLVNILIALAFLGHSLAQTQEERRPASRRAERRRRRGRPRGRPSRGFGVLYAPLLCITLLWYELRVVNGILETLRSLGRPIISEVADGIAWLSAALLVLATGYALWRETRVVALSVLVWRTFWIAVIALDFVILYRSGTRGAAVGLAAGFLAFAVGYGLWGRIRAVRVGSAAIMAVLAILALLFFSAREADWFKSAVEPNVMLRRLASIGPEDLSTNSRINSAKIGLSGFADRPLLGWGPENYTIAYDKHLTAEVSARSVESFDQAHNKVIEELTTKGALGFAGYMAVWGYIVWVAARRVRGQKREDQLFTLLIGSALVGYFVQNLFLFDTPGTAGQFYLLAGFMAYLDSAAPETALDVKASGERRPEAVPSPLRRLAFLRTDEAKLIAFVAVGVTVVVAIFFLIVGPYRGSRAVIYGMGAFPSQVTTWRDKSEYFERSILAAPGLANYPRRFMLSALASDWDQLNEQEARAALEAAEREGEAALESEPREWRIHLTLATVYQSASALDPSYLVRARELLEEGIKLAPERVELQQVLVRQFVAERDFEGAFGAIDDYVEAHSEYFEPFSPVYDIFASLRSDVARVAAAEGGQDSSQSEEDGEE